MKFVICHSSTATEPINTSNQKLASFRKCIKWEETSYPTLKDERYFDSFSRSLYITAKSHECGEVFDPAYTPSNYMMYMNMHKKNYHLPLMKKNFKNVRNSILTKIWSHPQMISWISSPVKNILMTNLIKFSRLIKHINKLNLKLKLHTDK